MKWTVLVKTKEEKQKVFKKLESLGLTSPQYKDLLRTQTELYITFNFDNFDWSYSPVSWKNKKECVNLQEFLEIELNETSLL